MRVLALKSVLDTSSFPSICSFASSLYFGICFMTDLFSDSICSSYILMYILYICTYYIYTYTHMYPCFMLATLASHTENVQLDQ